jgi:hypothetical protein
VVVCEAAAGCYILILFCVSFFFPSWLFLMTGGGGGYDAQL